jgi:hypothetical protein
VSLNQDASFHIESASWFATTRANRTPFGGTRRARVCGWGGQPPNVTHRNFISAVHYGPGTGLNSGGIRRR